MLGQAAARMERRSQSGSGKPKVRDQRSTSTLILRARQRCGCLAVMWNMGSAGVPESASKPRVWAEAEAGLKLHTRTQEC